MAFSTPPQLIEPARSGDADAAERLIEAVWPDAVRLATAIVGDSAAGEDAAQEACIALYRRIRTLRNAQAFHFWFYRIVVREASAVKRRRARWRALAQLPAGLRRVVVLHYFEDLSSSEIGSILGIPSPTVRFQLALARRRLRPHLKVRSLPANTPLRRLLLVEHNTIMLQYDLPGGWRRNENQLWVVLVNPKAMIGPSDEQSVGHLLPLGPFGPRGKVQERWQIGGEAVIIVQSKALPAELARIKHAMLAQRNRSLEIPRSAACTPHRSRNASVSNSVAPNYHARHQRSRAIGIDPAFVS